jgi:hypothetical protein
MQTKLNLLGQPICSGGLTCKTLGQYRVPVDLSKLFIFFYIVSEDCPISGTDGDLIQVPKSFPDNFSTRGEFQ